MSSNHANSPLARRPKAVRLGLRVTQEQEALIRKASAVVHKSATEFMLESACVAAEETLLDRTLFQVDEETWKRFQEALDRPAAVNPKLKRLLEKKPAWA
jgi:uncharacterized protein (DUF1778 family)